MSRRTFQLGIFTLWIATIVHCKSTTLLSSITCPDTHKLCGNTYCYDPATEICSKTNSDLTCIDACGKECYDSASQVCIYGIICAIGEDVCEVKYDNAGNSIEPPRLKCYNPINDVCQNGTLCSVGEDICEIKYDISSGKPIQSPQLRCYNPRSQRCLNDTLCYENRVCNGECMLNNPSYQYQVCANDNKTLCTVSSPYNNYSPNQIQLCNGTCFDIGKPPLRHCVNGIVECISNCAGTCYDKDQNVCINGSLCRIGYKLCESRPYHQCYDPVSRKCLNGTVCLNDRTCGGQCINNDYQVCANDKRTLCNVTSYYSNYRLYQMHICNGHRFDTSFQQCINGVVSCIDDKCADKCYHSAYHICLNSTLCSVGADLCEIKYDNAGNTIEPPRLQCYDPRSQMCLNQIVCYAKNRVCNGQCILYTSSYQYQVCANDNKTLCTVSRPYNNYSPNQIQLCNGTCFDIEERPRQNCVNGIMQCISNCSGTCYDKDRNVCLNGSLCLIGYKLCENQRYVQCYHPLSQKCLNGTVCSNDRTCGEQCINNDYQVCAGDKQTVCNVSKHYSNYRPNQVQLCRGVCYDSFSQQCVLQNMNSSTTTTTPSPSISTVNSISSYAWTNTSDFSASTSATNFSVATSNAEASPSSGTLFTTASTASPSVSSGLTSLLTAVAEVSAEYSSYETKTTTVTASPASISSFTLSLSSISSSKGTNIPSISSDGTSAPIFSSSSSVLNSLSSSSLTLALTTTDPGASITLTGTDPDTSINSTEASSSSLSHSSNSFTFITMSCLIRIIL